MRIWDIIQIGVKYLFVGLTAAVVTAFIVALVYRLSHKGKPMDKGKILWWSIFICYIVVVLGATLMERHSGWQNGKIQPLFYSYRDAWVDFSHTSWRNIILNILMFVPLGFLLPLGTKKHGSFAKTALLGFALTLFIELSQLVLGRGMFELDDLLNNTAGAMIGYGFFELVACVRGKKPWKRAAAAQIPLLVTIAAFGAIFTAYSAKDIGNIEGQYIVKCDAEVSSQIKYSDERELLPVYKCSILTKDDTVEFAKAFFENIGTQLDESRNDFYGGTAVFSAVDSYSLWVEYVGGGYNFTDFETTFPKGELKAVDDADESEIRAALLAYGIDIGKEAEFHDLGEGCYSFTAESDSAIGSLTCKYYENGCFSSIRNNLLSCEYYKDFEIISPNEAFSMIKDGKFRYYGGENPGITVGECHMEYKIDSKGYFQPVYVFDCEINGNDETIVIAAIQ